MFVDHRGGVVGDRGAIGLARSCSCDDFSGDHGAEVSGGIVVFGGDQSAIKHHVIGCRGRVAILAAAGVCGPPIGDNLFVLSKREGVVPAVVVEDCG